MFNRYGMPQGRYAQNAPNQVPHVDDANPIATAANRRIGPPTDQGAASQDDTGTSVTRDGRPNLALQNALGDSPAPTISVDPQRTFSWTPQQDRFPNRVNVRGGMNDAGPTGVDNTLSQPWHPPAATDPLTPDRVVSDAYRQFLGREPSLDEIRSQTGNGTFDINHPSLARSIANIRNSEEAKAYAARGAATTATGTPPPAANGGAPSGLDAEHQWVWDNFHSSQNHNPIRDPNETDYNYWIGKKRSDPNYNWDQRMFDQEGQGSNAGHFPTESTKPTTGGSNSLPDNTAIMKALEGGGDMNNDYVKNLLAQLMQSLATQRALK